VWSRAEEERESMKAFFTCLKKEKKKSGRELGVSAVYGRVRKVADRVKGVKRDG